MDWTVYLNDIMQICVIPLLGVLTTFVVIWIKGKTKEVQAKTDNEFLQSCLTVLETTVVNAILATNQTYVEALKKENAELKEAMGGQGLRVLKRVTERKVRIMFIDNRAVVGYKNRGADHKPIYIYEKPDPNNSKEMISYVDLLLDGMKEGDKPLSVPFKQFREEGIAVECRVSEVEEKEWTINQGTVRRREVEEYSMVDTDTEVPLDIVGKARFFTVDVPAQFGGPKKLKVHENYVNIK